MTCVCVVRQEAADSRSHFDGKTLTKRALDIDWSRANSEAFQRLCSEASPSASSDSRHVYEVLVANRHTVYGAFEYYCALGASYDGYAIGSNEFHSFVRDCHLADENSSHCTTAQLDAIFFANVDTKILDEVAKVNHVIACGPDIAGRRLSIAD